MWWTPKIEPSPVNKSQNSLRISFEVSFLLHPMCCTILFPELHKHFALGPEIQECIACLCIGIQGVSDPRATPCGIWSLISDSVSSPNSQYFALFFKSIKSGSIDTVWPCALVKNKCLRYVSFFFFFFVVRSIWQTV